ncbi:DUF2278 family protein [Paraburkholderia phosphatilytica]|uniref:DUF2278 family protein n=1 Tax=Paraburkholderia phosphatilytica TaxID=2282883 RepID=UPI000E48FCA7|nr:DUF2278 family protein [Paraburkholderia phosphatilytica]
MKRFPQRQYGVLTGTIQDGQLDPSGASPHYEIWIKGAGVDYRAAVNVKSDEGSEVYAYFDANWQLAAGLADPLANRTPGFTALQTGPNGQGLDYLRMKGLFPLDQMTQIPPEGSGVTLQNLLDAQIERAKADASSSVFVFGEYFQDQGSDKTFGFSPERGVHDIHMMQGNPRGGGHDADNRIYGDGALFIRFASETVALFVRFASQSLNTDDNGMPQN